METNPRRSRKRRRPRLTLRALMVMVMAFGGWLGWTVHAARVQRQTVTAIEKAGGSAWYDWECRDGRFDPCAPGRPQAPTWLVDALGVDYFGRVVSVHFRGDPGKPGEFPAPPGQLDDGPTEVGVLPDAVLARLRGLPGLVDLELLSQKVTIRGWAEVGRLGGLKRLRLPYSGIDDNGLARLRGLTRLEELRLPGCKVTDAGLAHLEEMTGLRVLDLKFNEVGRAGAAHLKGMNKLEVLNLRFTKVGDAGADDIQRALPNAKVIRPRIIP